MGRSARLAVGAIAAALAAERIGVNQVGAVVAIAMAALLVMAELGPSSRRGRSAWPIVLGAGLIAARLALLPAAGTLLTTPPAGSGPWSLTVLATGAPREGHQTATLGTGPDVTPGFLVAATLPRYPIVVPGDRVVLEGAIRPRPDSPYGEYLARIGAAGTLTARTIEVLPAPSDPGRELERLRRDAAEALARVLPEPEAGLAAGILIGLRDRVDRDLAAAFTTAGVSHVVAISGWNIAIVAAAVAALAGRLGRRRRSMVTVLAIVAYVAFAGASASVVRAAAMAGVVLLARESGRAGRASAALGWAATLLLVSDPKLIGDAGFQLSSLATAGLIAWATPLTERIESLGHGHVPRWLAESLGVSLAAQAATLPIVLVSFGRLAILSPVVNLFVVPLVAPAMAVGILALLGGLAAMAGVPPVVGAVMAAPGWVVLRILVALVEVAAGLPFASVTLEPPFDALAALATVAGLGALTWWRRQAWGASPAPRPAGDGGTRRPARPGADGRARRVAVLALIAAITVTGGVVVARPRGIASVTILDVGQGDAILVEGSRGGRLLIDGGPDPDRLLVALDQRIPPWDRRIDSIVLSHPHEDHVAGLALLLERYRVGRVMEPGMRGRGPGYAALLGELNRGHAPIRSAIAAGDRLRVDEVALRALWPRRGEVPVEPIGDGTTINNVSVVLLGQVGARRFLLMGDLEEDIDPELMAQGLPRVDLLKIAHHGSRTATTQPFIDAVRPRIAVVSVGAGNPYGHPTRATLDRLVQSGVRVLRTDRDGTVVVGFELNRLTVRTEGPRPAKPSATAGGGHLLAATSPRVAWARGISGWTGVVRYHRADECSRAGGGRCPPAVPGPRGLVRAACARGRGGRGLARGADRRARHAGRPPVGRGRRAAPRRGQGPSPERSIARAPPRRGVGRLADASGTSGAGAGRGGPSRHAPSRRRGLPPVGRVRIAGGADRRVRGQAGGPAPRIDGRAVRVVAPALSAKCCGHHRWRLG